MYTVISVHTVAIIIIEIYNYFEFIEDDDTIKEGITGLIYLGIKLVVMIIDLGMIKMLWTTYGGLLAARDEANLSRRM